VTSDFEHMVPLDCDHGAATVAVVAVAQPGSRFLRVETTVPGVFLRRFERWFAVILRPPPCAPSAQLRFTIVGDDPDADVALESVERPSTPEGDASLLDELEVRSLSVARPIDGAFAAAMREIDLRSNGAVAMHRPRRDGRIDDRVVASLSAVVAARIAGRSLGRAPTERAGRDDVEATASIIEACIGPMLALPNASDAWLRGFVDFAAGELAFEVGTDVHPRRTPLVAALCNGGPNSPFLFGFTEFALLVADELHHGELVEPWMSLARAGTAAAEAYLLTHAYIEADDVLRREKAACGGWLHARRISPERRGRIAESASPLLDRESIVSRFDALVRAGLEADALRDRPSLQHLLPVELDAPGRDALLWREPMLEVYEGDPIRLGDRS
jgi:hypothetical protein